MSKRTDNKGRFQKGHDPRRHTFSREECQRGFVAALESIERRYPGADGHFIMCGLIGSKPGYYINQAFQYYSEHP
jgi:hypothetical protein